MKLGELGEFELIDRIRARVSVGEGVRCGIGDDAAVLDLPDGYQLLTSTDLLIEDVHFRRDWTDSESLGRKAVAVNFSDIAAMGGAPRYLYLGLACPGEAELDDIEAFLDGALAEAKDFGVSLVGGDTCRSPGPWMVSVTVEGCVPAGRSVRRGGAQAGDLIMVSGTLGDSALALHLLHQGKSPEETLSVRHHRPTARVELGRRLGETGIARAMIDISDGLLSDLEHILRASQVNGIVNEDEIPLSGAFRSYSSLDPALRQLALTGGEDYELLFTVSPERAAEAVALGAGLGVPITTIGTIREGDGRLGLQDATGMERPSLFRGYDHFRQP